MMSWHVLHTRHTDWSSDDSGDDDAALDRSARGASNSSNTIAKPKEAIRLATTKNNGAA